MPSYNSRNFKRNYNRPGRSRTVRSSRSGYSGNGYPGRAQERIPGRSGRTNRARRGAQARNRRRESATGAAVKGAENRLKNFRQASILAVAITGFIMLMFAPDEAGLAAQDTAPQEEAVMADAIEANDEMAVDDPVAEEIAEGDSTVALSSKESADEAIGALHNLWEGFLYNLPKILIALGTLVFAWIIARLLKLMLQRALGRWGSSNAIISIVSICVWLLAVGVALSVVVGDIRALVGSLGLVGLALSWSLQTPIESFTGWLLNSFQGYYRVGDRVRVGDVFGDVYRIDFLTTTVWEIGDPYEPGFVQAEQPTGRMVTFPNNEILTGTVTNLTGDFPYVWDELAVAVANESDMPLSLEVLEKVALNLLGGYMVEPARKYGQLLKRAGLGDNVSEKPQVFMSLQDSWTNIIIRYLVGARERRKWKSELTLRVTQELSKPEYTNKIIPVYPRQQVQFINPEGVPVEVKSFRNDGEA
ncbi:small-conductance mechanosensitive channel [Pontibacter ummariensis]|uniref:Small-conductance mechanosensitive channel n=1 Tax=Pontibacter ummariensis TaxID=1610492 RepID=A0A239IMJ2_9BACT|nr:mechanosensitive ion channel domain-containing protein [Pontibacter ummariensis]PRY09874.1 small-conductance mechanosensitive channel [Pontibacter ummariensis]SNS93634.1 Small-conductance mechanosensitive channel [Pontibacter ummariensis]